jgi:hypothetical protein
VHVEDDKDDSWRDFPTTNLQDEPKILGRGMHREERNKEPDDFLSEFLGRNAGPVGGEKNLETPGQFFDLFFSSDILEELVKETNDFALSSGERNWRDVTVVELRCFFLHWCEDLGSIKSLLVRCHGTKYTVASSSSSV